MGPLGYVQPDPHSEASQSTSLTLVQKMRGDDPLAWQRMVERYGPLVFAWIRLSGLNEHDAADVLQEVFSSVHNSLDRFRRTNPTDRFRNWLWTITRRRTADFLRKLYTQPSAVGGTDAYLRLQTLPEELPVPEDADVATAEALLVRRTLEYVRAEFPDHVWQACLLTAIEGRTPTDVAADLGMTVGAVYVARSRVLKRLREELGDFQ